MISFTKNDLILLELMTKFSDSSRPDTDKFGIKSVGKNIFLYQFFNDMEIYQIFKSKEECEKINSIFETKGFFQRTKLCTLTDEIKINDLQVKFGKKSEFSFEDCGLDNLGDILIENLNKKIVKYFEGTIKPIGIIDLQKLKYCKTSIGEDNGLNVLCIYENHFITSNYHTCSSVIKTDNKNLDNIFLPKVFFDIVDFFKSEKIEIFQIEEMERYLIYFPLMEIYILLPLIKECVIPNLFSEKMRKDYYHSKKISFMKDDIKDALQSINLTTVQDQDNRIQFKIGDKVEISCIDALKVKSNSFKSKAVVNAGAKEIIDFDKCDDSLKDVSFWVSGKSILDIVKGITEDKVVFRLEKDTNAISAISIMDEQEDTLYITLLHEAA